MTSAARLGILGGTFDPVHAGHVDTALAARQALALDRVILMTSHIPPHRPVQPVASAYHRFAMAALAVNGVDGLEAWDMELSAPGPTYTADTLARLHADGAAPIADFFHHRCRCVCGYCDVEPLPARSGHGALRRRLASRIPGQRARREASGTGKAYAAGATR